MVLYEFKPDSHDKSHSNTRCAEDFTMLYSLSVFSYFLLMLSCVSLYNIYHFLVSLTRFLAFVVYHVNNFLQKYSYKNKNVQFIFVQIGEWSPTGGVYSHLSGEKSSDNNATRSKVYVVTSIEVGTY